MTLLSNYLNTDKLKSNHVVVGSSTSAISVSTGYTNLNNDPQRSSVSQIIVHHSYNSNVYENDIALVKLSSNISFSATRKPITISNAYTYLSGTNAVVSGWGRREVGGPPSLTQLFKSNVVVESCNNTKITARQSTNQSYLGDSGGHLTIPSAIGNLLIGIVSSGYISNPTNYQTKYTNVGNYYSWIASYTNLHSITGDDLLCGTSTFTITPIPLNHTLTLSPNIAINSQSGGTLDFSNVPAGIYILKLLTANDKEETFKIILN